jgi:hypothetical protein
MVIGQTRTVPVERTERWEEKTAGPTRVSFGKSQGSNAPSAVSPLDGSHRQRLGLNIQMNRAPKRSMPSELKRDVVQ